MSVPSCRLCKYLYVRDISSTQEAHDQFWAETAEHLYNGAREPAYYCCGHDMARQANRHVGCYEMRNLGAPCTPEGLLYEAAGEDGK